MADRFEARLEQLFAEPMRFDDETAFAGRVQGRLGRGQTTRNLLIACAGLVGGVVAVGQVVNANLSGAVQSVNGELAPVNAALAQPLQDERLSDLMQAASAWMPASSTGMEVMWTAAARGVAGLAFLATRVLGEV